MKKIIFISIIFLSLSSVFPLFVLAQVTSTDVPYPMLSGDTPISPGGTADIGTFLPAVFKLGIGVAGALAVIYIIIGGMQYLSTDSVDDKNDGREKIKNALTGLLLAISAYAILATINPKLVNLNLSIEVQKQGDALSTNTSAPPPTDTPPTGCLTCEAMPSDQSIIPSKTAAQNGCSGSGPCVVDPGLRNKLYTLNQKIKNTTPRINWWVTEMYPPTVGHDDPCHKNGTCVDAALTSPKTLNNVIAFLKAIDASGFSNFIYEKCPQAAADALKIQLASTGFGSRIKCPRTNEEAGGYESAHIVK